jgi:hypothetical protein
LSIGGSRTTGAAGVAPARFESGKLAGIGIFPEAIEHNPIVYEAATGRVQRDIAGAYRLVDGGRAESGLAAVSGFDRRSRCAALVPLSCRSSGRDWRPIISIQPACFQAASRVASTGWTGTGAAPWSSPTSIFSLGL